MQRYPHQRCHAMQETLYTHQNKTIREVVQHNPEPHKSTLLSSHSNQKKSCSTTNRDKRPLHVACDHRRPASAGTGGGIATNYSSPTNNNRITRRRFAASSRRCRRCRSDCCCRTTSCRSSSLRNQGGKVGRRQRDLWKTRRTSRLAADIDVLAADRFAATGTVDGSRWITNAADVAPDAAGAANLVVVARK
jgi:hypothetical protein